MKHRNRTVIAASNNGGSQCTGSLAEVQPCNHQLCPNSQAKVNCKWNLWEPWGVCDHCGGTQTRIRTVLKHALRGGRKCEPGDAEDVKECDGNGFPGGTFQRYCGNVKWCVWAPWGVWGACSGTCGNTTRKRRRDLKASPFDPYTTTLPPTMTPGDALRKLYEVHSDAAAEPTKIEKAAKRVDKQRQSHSLMQEIVLAFGAGGASIFFLLTAMRACSSRRSSSSTHGGIEMTSQDIESSSRLRSGSTLE